MSRNCTFFQCCSLRVDYPPFLACKGLRSESRWCRLVLCRNKFLSAWPSEIWSREKLPRLWQLRSNPWTVQQHVYCKVQCHSSWVLEVNGSNESSLSNTWHLQSHNITIPVAWCCYRMWGKAFRPEAARRVNPNIACFGQTKIFEARNGIHIPSATFASSGLEWRWLELTKLYNIDLLFEWIIFLFLVTADMESSRRWLCTFQENKGFGHNCDHIVHKWDARVCECGSATCSEQRWEWS